MAENSPKVPESKRSLEGTVVGECMPRYRHQEFLRFMRRLDREFPPDLNLHLILESYGTHKHLKMKNWLAKHRRFQLHFTPTTSSWPNLVERWFGNLTNKRIRRATFCECRGMGAGSRRVPGREQQTAKAVHLDGHGRRADLGEGPSLYSYFRGTTLM